MVEGISSNFEISNYQIAKRPVVHPQHDATNPITPNMIQGLESLGIYNMTLVKHKDNFNHPRLEPLAPIDITPEELIQQGVKEIKDPNGNVEYYTINNIEQGTVTNYFPTETDKNKIGQIEVQDYQTGKIIKTQNNWLGDYCNSKNCSINYYPLGEDVSYFARYEDGQLRTTSKWFKDSLGNSKDYCIEYDHNNKPHYNIYVDRKNHSNLNVSLDENKRVDNISNTIEQGNKKYTRDIQLHNGAIIGVEETQNVSVHIPNYMEADTLQDKDLIPARRFNQSEIAEKYVNSPNLKYNGNNTVKEFIDGNTKVEFNDNFQVITEYIDKDTKKITEYNEKEDYIHVTYKKCNATKSLCIENNKPKYYDEYINNNIVKSLSFDENGYLTQAY